MSCLDLLAFHADKSEADIGNKTWDQQLALLPARAETHDALTKLRTGFIARAAIAGGQHRVLRIEGANRGSQAMRDAGLLDTDRDSADPPVLPPGSARLQLRFELLTPLLTLEQDTFTLFDNAMRKDRLFLRPHLSAAAVKGLLVDAYQRAFPGAIPWTRLGEKDPDRTRVFRGADDSARRLFGLADVDDEDDDSASRRTLLTGRGRLRLEPIWFDQVQFLVMNPQDPKTAAGTVPIQFEAAAPNQEAFVTLRYLNPAGLDDSDERTVRADLARLVWAMAQYWPALNLGAKRLAGYGAIRPRSARLDATGWSAPAADWQGEGAWDELAHWLNEGT